MISRLMGWSSLAPVTRSSYYNVLVERLGPLQVIAPSPIGIYRSIVFYKLVNLAKHLLFEIFDVIVRDDSNCPQLHPRHSGRVRGYVAFQSDPLCQKEINGVKISADPIMEGIDSDRQHSCGRRCKSFTFRQHFYAGLAKALPDITLKLHRLQPELFNLNI